MASPLAARVHGRVHHRMYPRRVAIPRCRSSLRRCLRTGDFRSCVGVGAKHLVGLFLWPRGSTKVWIDVLPDHSAFGGNLEEPAEPALVDERVAVRQTLSVGYRGAEEIRHRGFL